MAIRKDIILLSMPEFLFVFLVYIGILMKFMYLPIGNFAYTIFSFTLSFVYMVWGTLLFSRLGFKEIFNNKKQKGDMSRILFSAAGGLGMAVYTILFWSWILGVSPLNVFLGASIGLILILTLVAIILILRDKSFVKTYTRFMLSAILVAVPHLLFYLIRPSLGIHHYQ